MAQDEGKSFDPASLTNEELGYIAGFFDGEGSVTIHENFRPSPRGKSPNHTLQVSIGNTDPRVLAWLHKYFGGSLTIRPSLKPNHREVTQWILRSNGAAAFLSAVLPFLRMKIEQAKIGISFQSEKGRYRRDQLSQDEIAFRESKRVAIRLLNGRNVA
jgi:hypothetical protein